MHTHDPKHSRWNPASATPSPVRPKPKTDPAADVTDVTSRRAGPISTKEPLGAAGAPGSSFQVAGAPLPEGRGRLIFAMGYSPAPSQSAP